MLCAFATAQVAIPTLDNGVMDETGILTNSERNALNQKIMQFEADTGSQIAVLIIPTLDGEDIVDYTVRVIEDWQLGRKNIDDSVLLFVALNDRKMRIEVGDGLEGAIPDLAAMMILEDHLMPAFRSENYGAGIMAAVDDIIGKIQGEALPSISDAPLEPFRKYKQFATLEYFLWLSCRCRHYLHYLANLKKISSKSPTDHDRDHHFRRNCLVLQRFWLHNREPF